MDKVDLSCTYLVTFCAPGMFPLEDNVCLHYGICDNNGKTQFSGIILAVIHPWQFDGCDDSTHWEIVGVSFAILFGISILFCLYCHMIATFNCETGPNYHDSSGIRRRCSGCIINHRMYILLLYGVMYWIVL